MQGGESIMHLKANYEIRRVAKESGIYLWQIAYALGISDSDLSRKLREELVVQEKDKILKLITDLKRKSEEELLLEERGVNDYVKPI